MKTMLVVWLLAGQNNAVFQYAAHFDTEQQCLKAAAQERDKRTGLLSYPVKKADCVLEVKIK